MPTCPNECESDDEEVPVTKAEIIEEIIEVSVEEKVLKPEVEVYVTTVPEIPEDLDAFGQIIEEANGRPFVLDFQYDECSPC